MGSKWSQHSYVPFRPTRFDSNPKREIRERELVMLTVQVERTKEPFFFTCMAERNLFRKKALRERER